MYYCDVSCVFHIKRVFEDVRKGTSIVQERVRAQPSVSGRYHLLKVQRFPDDVNNSRARGDFLPTPHFWGVPLGVGHTFIYSIFPKRSFLQVDGQLSLFPETPCHMSLPVENPLGEGSRQILTTVEVQTWFQWRVALCFVPPHLLLLGVGMTSGLIMEGFSQLAGNFQSQ